MIRYYLLLEPLAYHICLKVDAKHMLTNTNINTCLYLYVECHSLFIQELPH